MMIDKIEWATCHPPKYYSGRASFSDGRRYDFRAYPLSGEIRLRIPRGRGVSSVACAELVFEAISRGYFTD
jgi:hypothetical protein